MWMRARQRSKGCMNSMARLAILLHVCVCVYFFLSNFYSGIIVKSALSRQFQVCNNLTPFSQKYLSLQLTVSLEDSLVGQGGEHILEHLFLRQDHLLVCKVPFPIPLTPLPPGEPEVLQRVASHRKGYKVTIINYY